MGDIWETIGRYFEHGTTGNALLDFFFRFAQAMLILVFAFGLGRRIRGQIKKSKILNKSNQNMGVLVSNLIYILFLLVAIVAVLSIFTDAGTRSLLTLLGFVGVGLSLALQDVIKNLIAGIYLLVEQPFKIGDTIRVKDVEGQVINIEIRTTTIKTTSEIKVVVPNLIVFTEIVTNKTTYDRRLLTVKLELPPEISMETASTKIKEVLDKFVTTDLVIDIAPTIVLEQILLGKTMLRVEFWSPRSAINIQVGSQVAVAFHEAMPGTEIVSVG